MRIGFSTGSIALSDVRRGVQMVTSWDTHYHTRAIELSALREDELDPLLESLNDLDLRPFKHVSLHAPSKRIHFTENELVKKLQQIADRRWPIIVHPDIIENFKLWEPLGPTVCIENMDKRKKVGKTAVQLLEIFKQLPDATFCFDIGHAQQIDPTMQEAKTLLQYYHNRLRQVHMSYVNSQSQHERLNFESIQAFKQVAHLIDGSIPIILETPVSISDIDAEIKSVENIFQGSK